MNYIVSGDSIREDSSLTLLVLLAGSDCDKIKWFADWRKAFNVDLAWCASATAIWNKSIGPFTALNLVREEASWCILTFSSGCFHGASLLRVVPLLSCKLLSWLALFLFYFVQIVGSHASKTLFQVDQFSWWSNISACGTATICRHEVREFVRVDVSEVVEITIFLGHGSKLTGLDWGLCWCFGEEFGVDVADVRPLPNIGYKGRRNLLHVHLVPIDRLEERVRFELGYATCAATNSLVRLHKLTFQ